jgi:hypothetical protein
MERDLQLQNNIHYWRQILRKDTLSVGEILSLRVHSLRESIMPMSKGEIIMLPSRFPLRSFLDEQVSELDILLIELTEIIQKGEYRDKEMDTVIYLNQLIPLRWEMIADRAIEHQIETTIEFSSHRVRLLNAFPDHLREDVVVVADFLAPVSHIYLDSDWDQKIVLNSNTIFIPQRISIEDTRDFHWSDTQETILNCIYLLHHDGYIRQERLERLLSRDTHEYFIMPYIFKLLGEYIIEILDILDQYLDDRMVWLYLKFIAENPFYARQTKDRMISYWDVYYRWSGYHYRLEEYVGWKIFHRIKEAKI